MIRDWADRKTRFFPMSTLLSINNYYYHRGGAETVFLEHNRMFERKGWRVTPFAMKHPRNLATEWDRYFVEEIEFGQRYTPVQKLMRVPKVIYSFEARRKLDLLIRHTGPAIAHAHNIYHHISPSILGLLKRRNVPVVLTLHDLKIACPAYSMLAPDGVCERCRGGRIHNVVTNRCIKGSLALSSVAFAEAALHRVMGTYEKCVNRFVVPSRFYIGKLVEWGYPESRFKHVPNFVDPGNSRPAFTPGKSFLYVGRLSREKGLATLIRAAAEAGLPVSLVGNGPQLEELRSLAAELSADVEFRGFLGGEELQDAIRAARAVVLPSEWYENAPMSVLEAYALGKPVIGARIGGIPELVRESETGFGFPSGDVAALADLLRQVADSPDSRIEEMGRAGRLWVEQDFSAARYLERVVAIYEELGVKMHGSSVS